MRLHRSVSLSLALLLWSGPALAADKHQHSAAPAPQSLRHPSKGTPQPIGSYANGCVRGADALPADGQGFQVMNLSRHRNYGHPLLLAYLKALAGEVEREGLGILSVGDMSMPRGGRMPTGHASHQMGLDADIWFALDLGRLPVAEREREDFATMVDTKAQRVNTNFGPAQARLVRLAAAAPHVTRIFVNPAIKLALCEGETGDKSWLRKVRPWFGHAAHLHVRLDCPPDAKQCETQEPPPEGDGCGEELLSWFKPPPPSTGSAPPPKPPPPPPAACLALYAEKD
ncbi:penicillin-insensitive murein endopeptidase [Niveispirillum sp.]|uniref:penicillin-insensitive murein endopeptidase n=1 Tax=Niveispirillum sp. TaxID=1917217 RepID=UPI001B4421A2|nr:penicillin-insensitive murein endopeptidase [Niveispirillum sp.]MBP7339043.1 penicillin-insensitive murein endopeptidase [Niveispirillum sp.]